MTRLDSFPFGPDELLREAPGEVVRLAEALCLSARIDHAFLRHARLSFLPEAGAGVEAGLWFSPLCQSHGRAGVSLVPRVARHLRDRLRDDPQQLQRIRVFTTTVHENAEPSVRLVESLIWVGMTGAAIDAEQGAAIGGLVEALLAEGTAPDDLSRWLLCHLPALPGELRRHGDLLLLESLAAQRLGEPLPAPAGTVPRLRGLSRRLLREIDLGVVVRSDGVEISWPPEPGSQVITAAGRATVRLSLRSWPADAAADPVQVAIRPGKTLLPLGLRQIRTEAGAVVATSLCRLDWTLAAVSADGVEVWTREHGAVEIKDSAGNILDELTLSGPGTPIAAFSTGGSRLVLANGTEAVLWESGARHVLTARAPILAVAVGQQAIALATEAAIDLYNPGVEEWTNQLIPNPARCLSFSPSGGLNTGNPPLINPFIVASDGRDGQLAWVQPDGSVAWMDDFMSEWDNSTPWQATSVAIGAGARPTVYVAGNDSYVLAFDGAGDPRRLEVGFIAKQVKAFSDRLAIVGAGGALQLECADGTAYLVKPGMRGEGEARDTWDTHSLVLHDALKLMDLDEDIVTRAAKLADLFAPLRGAAILIGQSVPDDEATSRFPSDREAPEGLAHLGEVLTLIAALHSRGLRALVEVPRGRADDTIQRWLRTPIDGVIANGGQQLNRSAQGLFDAVSISRTWELLLEDLSYTVGRLTPTMPDATVRLLHDLDDMSADQFTVLLALPGLWGVPAEVVARMSLEDRQRLGAALSLRANLLALKAGDFTVESLRDGDTMLIRRTFGEETITCVANMSRNVEVYLHPVLDILYPDYPHIGAGMRFLLPGQAVWTRSEMGDPDASG